ncbi:MAG: undecaprenyldiphospho-muramoylpentapeptide beta-N-acetylglucosaminyltransferase [Hyphomonadaceae bacterium]|nr:undecaprenyldiphospho-muramoylpentapeptide beta-N-acetylglucosaminyltransferase [Hyphomonadaceae bacterium]
MTKTLLIAAGGTGGHMFPAAAFAEEMRKRGWKVVLMTDARGRRYTANFPADSIEDVPAATIQSKNPVVVLQALMKIASGVSAAGKRLKALDPAIVAGFGGYPSLPALWAARAQKRPILIHEQNAVLGRVNRYFAKDAAAIACGFDRLDRLPESAQARKHVVGNPVRPPILAVREAPYPVVAPGAPLNVLVTGGSQGARLFGDVVPVAVTLLSPDIRSRLKIVQQVREEQIESACAIYSEAKVDAELAAFFNDMGDRLKAAHLVVARAGASSVTELQAAGRPSILVPLAIAADDHQTANAEGVVQVGAADVITEADFDPERLAALLQKRLAAPHDLAVRAAAARAAGKPDAAQALADIAEGLAKSA